MACGEKFNIFTIQRISAKTSRTVQIIRTENIFPTHRNIFNDILYKKEIN